MKGRRWFVVAMVVLVFRTTLVSTLSSSVAEAKADAIVKQYEKARTLLEGDEDDDHDDDDDKDNKKHKMKKKQYYQQKTDRPLQTLGNALIASGHTKTGAGVLAMDAIRDLYQTKSTSSITLGESTSGQFSAMNIQHSMKSAIVDPNKWASFLELQCSDQNPLWKSIPQDYIQTVKWWLLQWSYQDEAPTEKMTQFVFGGDSGTVSGMGFQFIRVRRPYSTDVKIVFNYVVFKASFQIAPRMLIVTESKSNWKSASSKQHIEYVGRPMTGHDVNVVMSIMNTLSSSLIAIPRGYDSSSLLTAVDGPATIDIV